MEATVSYLTLNWNLVFNVVGGIILGDIFMQAFNVIFDRQNKQIGFAPVKDCNGMYNALGMKFGVLNDI